MTDDPIAKRLDELVKVYRDGLLGDTLPFWLPRSVDREHGGFMLARDRDGALLDTDKGMWQQCRFTWLLGELYNNVEARDEWLEWCKHGIDFISKHGFDPADGRMWFHVTREGAPLRKRRYSFTEAFAAIAFGEFAKATGSDEYAAKARAAFRSFVEAEADPPKFTDARPSIGLGFPMITIVTAQELRDSIGLEDAHRWIDRSIHAIRSNFMKPDLRAVMEQVAPDGALLDHFDGRTLNPGHAMEAAWFVMTEGRHRGDNSLIQTGLDMLDWTWERGWDGEHGGILYFVDLHGKPVQEYWHDMKFWWPHNETILATLLAYHLTGDAKYANWHAQVHDWSYRHFPDPEHGEWYGYLHRDGSASVRLKGNLWKGPFHLPRMQLLCWKLTEQLVAGNPDHHG
jgi:N-acylglucosamine 2-epimerase